jgi:steroid 5-alpha reductase family enzyme
MNPFMLVLIGWAAMALVMAAMYLLARAIHNAGLVDAAWAAGIAALAVFYAVTAGGDPARRILTACLAGAWGLRLATYLTINRVIGAEEDGRYQMLRQRWADKAERNFLLFFQVQALWAVLFSIPLLPAMASDVPAGQWHDVAAVAVWLLAVGGESLADRQLSRFRRRPDSRGTTCREGLWRYSRHPNYFFEWLHWFTYPLLAWPAAGWWVALGGPVVMLLFLYKITGIPYTEKRALASRGEDYRRYQRTTSALIPWPPKEDPA